MWEGKGGSMRGPVFITLLPQCEHSVDSLLMTLHFHLDYSHVYGFPVMRKVPQIVSKINPSNRIGFGHDLVLRKKSYCSTRHLWQQSILPWVFTTLHGCMQSSLICCLGAPCRAHSVPVIADVFSLGAPVLAAGELPLVPKGIRTTLDVKDNYIHSLSKHFKVTFLPLSSTVWCLVSFPWTHDHKQFWTILALGPSTVPMESLSCLLCFQWWRLCLTL